MPKFLLPVLQQDRERAASFAWSEGDVGTEQLRYDIRQGKRDDHPVVQAFAACRAEVLLEVTDVLDLYVKTPLTAPTGWTEEQRDWHEIGQLDMIAALANALSARVRGATRD